MQFAYRAITIPLHLSLFCVILQCSGNLLRQLRYACLYLWSLTAIVSCMVMDSFDQTRIFDKQKFKFTSFVIKTNNPSEGVLVEQRTLARKHMRARVLCPTEITRPFIANEGLKYNFTCVKFKLDNLVFNYRGWKCKSRYRKFNPNMIMNGKQWRERE